MKWKRRPEDEDDEKEEEEWKREKEKLSKLSNKRQEFFQGGEFVNSV